MIPTDLDFNDFEYFESRELYIPKEATDSGIYYCFGFENGKLSSIHAQKSLNFELPEYLEDVLFSFYVSEIGTAVIYVPEYVIVE